MATHPVVPFDADLHHRDNLLLLRRAGIPIGPDGVDEEALIAWAAALGWRISVIWVRQEHVPGWCWHALASPPEATSRDDGLTGARITAEAANRQAALVAVLAVAITGELGPCLPLDLPPIQLVR